MIQLRQKTKTQEARENRDRAIYEEYEQLLRDPKQSRIEAQRYLQRKYGFARQCTVYDNAEVYGNAKVYGETEVFGNAWVFGSAVVYGMDKVCGDTELST